MSARVLPFTALSATVAAAIAMSGCGAADDRPAPPPRSQTAAVAPLAQDTPEAGEIVVHGQAAPASHGPYRFAGTYRVSFEQVAPEDPRMDFGDQTAFTVTLDRQAEVEDRGSVRVFSAAAPRGAKRVRLNGRFYVDVAFGDFPYALRFTPVR